MVQSVGGRRSPRIEASRRRSDRTSYMRSLSGRVNVGVLIVCLFFGVTAAAIGVVGIIGVRSATATGAEIASDELTTATVTAELSRRLGDAYSTSQALMLSADPAARAQLASTLSVSYTHLTL